MKKVRHWLADRLDDFASWIECRSRDVNDWAWRIRPRKQIRPSAINDLILTTLRHRGHELADNVTRNNAILQELRKRAR